MSDEKLIIDGLELIEKINNWRNKDFADSEEYTDRVICDVLDSVIEMIYDTEPVQPQGIDKDRLIEELEKIKFTAFLTLANSGNEALDKAWEYSSTYLDIAIETVKRGGQND